MSITARDPSPREATKYEQSAAQVTDVVCDELERDRESTHVGLRLADSE